jgi:DNA polymerase elongation subunit (family B)
MSDITTISDDELIARYKAAKSKVSASNAMQMALKILLNSGYGAISNEHFHYFKIAVAEAITTAGQTAVQWVARDLNEFMVKGFGDGDYITYADTDSNYLNVQPIVDKFIKFKPEATTHEIVQMLDKYCESKLQPVINQSCNDLAEYLNAYEQKLNMKREAISETAIWAAKKRYAMMVWNSEGVQYNPAKMKVQGLEVVRSTTPSWSKVYLKEIYKVCLTGNEKNLHTLYKDIEMRYNQMPIEEIAVPTGVNHITKYTDSNGYAIKGCQMHIRAAINHNRLIKELGLNSIPPIQDAEKIKYFILKNNHMNLDAIAFRNKLPEEFGVVEFIDKKTTFNKSFLEPAKTFVELIGWHLEKKATLNDLF